MSFQPVSFGKYELVSRLAAGGMAEIFLARTKSHPGLREVSRHQTDPRPPHAGSRVRAHVPRRGARRCDPRSSEHRADLRRRPRRQRVLHRDGVPARPQPHRDRARGREARLRQAAARARRLDADAELRRSALRARQARLRRTQPRDRSPRRHAAERRRQLRRQRQGRRLRHRQGGDARGGDARRHAQGQDRLHVARAVPRRRRRSPQRHLRRRHHPVRADDGQAALSRALRLRHAQEDHRRAGAVAARPAAVLSGVPQRDRRALLCRRIPTTAIRPRAICTPISTRSRATISSSPARCRCRSTWSASTPTSWRRTSRPTRRRWRRRRR